MSATKTEYWHTIPVAFGLFWMFTFFFDDFLCTFVSGIVLGVALVPLAQLLPASKIRDLIGKTDAKDVKAFEERASIIGSVGYDKPLPPEPIEETLESNRGDSGTFDSEEEKAETEGIESEVNLDEFKASEPVHEKPPVLMNLESVEEPVFREEEDDDQFQAKEAPVFKAEKSQELLSQFDENVHNFQNEVLLSPEKPEEGHLSQHHSYEDELEKLAKDEGYPGYHSDTDDDDILAKQEQERIEEEKRVEQVKLEKERLEQERIEEERRLEQERLEKEKLEQERIEEERRLEQERLEKERLEQERIEEERRLEQERLEKEKLEQERIEEERRLEQERLEKERIEQERIEEERRLEQERLEKERIEQERIEEERRLEQAKLEKERLEQERLEEERRLEQQRLEEERLEQERLEKERQEKEEQDRIERERKEQERQLEQERLEQQRIEEERLEQERFAKERQEQEQREQERIEAEKERSDQLVKNEPSADSLENSPKKSVGDVERDSIDGDHSDFKTDNDSNEVNRKSPDSLDEAKGLDAPSEAPKSEEHHQNTLDYLHSKVSEAKDKMADLLQFDHTEDEMIASKEVPSSDNKPSTFGILQSKMAEAKEQMADLLQDAQREHSPSKDEQEKQPRFSLNDDEAQEDFERMGEKSKSQLSTDDGEGDPWREDETEDNVSHRAVFGDDQDPDEHELDSMSRDKSPPFSPKELGDGKGDESTLKEMIDFEVNRAIDVDLNDPQVHEAATKIQAAFKGYKTRHDLKKQ